MNIYVIYKFDDYEIVKKKIDEISKVISPDSHIFMFENDCTSKLWRIRATRKLKECHLVILFDSLSGERNSIGKHILWEINKAEKLNKRIVVFKSDPNSKNRSWYEYDYSEKDPVHSRYKTVPIEESVQFMKNEYGWQMEDNLLHLDETKGTFTDTEMQLLLEQYRIMIETSERLMERRQEVVNLYTTLSTTLIAFAGASFAFSDIKICAVILFVSGLILLMLCRNWRISLTSYDMNNGGKFEVINTIEKRLPAEMFACEYKYNKLNGICSFSYREKVLPIIFSVLACILILIATTVFILSFLEKINLI